MTYEVAKFNANTVVKIIRHNLVTGGNAKTLYDVCPPEVQCLVRCQLTHGEKRALGLVADDEPDPVEMALRVRTREREEMRFGKQYDVARRLRTAKAKMYYDALVAA